MGGRAERREGGAARRWLQAGLRRDGGGMAAPQLLPHPRATPRRDRGQGTDGATTEKGRPPAKPRTGLPPCPSHPWECLACRADCAPEGTGGGEGGGRGGEQPVLSAGHCLVMTSLGRLTGRPPAPPSPPPPTPGALAVRPASGQQIWQASLSPEAGADWLVDEEQSRVAAPPACRGRQGGKKEG